MRETTSSCPGNKKFNQPEIAGNKNCPECGAEIEFFSDEFFIKCKCGKTVAREIDTNSCVLSCRLGDGKNKLPPCLTTLIPEQTKQFIIEERKKRGL